MLLAHRSPSRRWFPDVWDFPGGHVEQGEAELPALARELAEELGVQDLVVDPFPLARIDDISDSLRLSIWTVRDWAGVPANRSPDEHDELRWVTPEEASGLVLAHRSYVDLLTRLLQEAA